jgi:hypothetical protein
VVVFITTFYAEGLLQVVKAMLHDEAIMLNDGSAPCAMLYANEILVHLYVTSSH